MNLKNYFYLFSFLFTIILFPKTSNCQDYSINTTACSFKIESNQYKGYQTTFNLPYKEIKKAWWKYIKAKTYIFNHKTYYELKIPSKKNEEEIILLSKLQYDSAKTITTLYAALSNNTKLGNSKKQEYNESIKALLIDFELSYYTNTLQRSIKCQEKKVVKISRAIARLKNTDSGEIEVLKDRLMLETDKLEKLKHQLNLIK